MFRRVIFIFAVVTGLSFNVSGQAAISEAAVFIPYLTIKYGLYMPGGDLANRFGLTNYLGANFTVKTKSNFTFGLNGAGYFGNDVKEQNMLHEMRTDDGNILDDNAIISTVLFLERGFQITGEAGKIFTLGNSNPNSGILFTLGGGYNMHWIRIENQKNNIPQLTKEDKKYYDRRVAGFMLTEYIGYQFFSNKGLANFNAGFEFMQGFNSSYRTYNIDLKGPVTDDRTDLYFGFKIGWSILFRKTMSTAYYID